VHVAVHDVGRGELPEQPVDSLCEIPQSDRVARSPEPDDLLVERPMSGFQLDGCTNEIGS
jgi:hypothetical protein